MTRTRIGFIGVGGMGQAAHLKNYVQIDDCEVVALAEVRPETARLVAGRYGVPKVYADHREMLANEKLDGVVASQPYNRHAVLMPDVYGKVKCVFTEKPLAASVEAAQMLADKAAQTGTVHMVGYHKRSDPAIAYAMKTIAQWRSSGEMGRQTYVRLTMPSGDWTANGFIGLLNAGDSTGPVDCQSPPCDMDTETAGQFDSFINYYIHQINLLAYLFGERYKVTFASKSGIVMAAQSASGMTGVIEMTPYRTTMDWEESAMICFEKGYIVVRLTAPLAMNRCGTVEIFADPDGQTPVRSIPTMPWVHPMRQQAINFVKVCRGEMKPLCEPAQAVEDLQIARQYIRLRCGK